MESTVFSPQDSPTGRRTSRDARTAMNTRGANSVAFNAVLVTCGVGMGLALGLPVVDGTLSELHVPGGLAMFIGSVTGLAGTYLALMMVLLASRMPALERMLGQGGVIDWHRRLAPWPILLIVTHAVFLSLSYAQAAKRGVWSEVGVIVNTFPNMVTATVALGIMVLIGVISIRQIRLRIPRENWWLIHLTMYVALVISFAHEVALGPSFVRHPLMQDAWTTAWLLVASIVLIYRVGFPVYRSLRHQLRVVEVKREGPDVVSIVLKGRDLERLAIAGGQFFEWRFMTAGMWWQAHPFTVSALPQPPFIRMTVKGVGDFSRKLATVKVGVRVGIEGPYGSFTKHVSKRNLVLLIAGGIGVTAVRSLLEDLPPRSRPVIVLRASSIEDLALLVEIETLARFRKGVVHQLVGSRHDVALESMLALVPDVAQRDVFICGSDDFVRAAVAVVQRAGVAPEALHYEAYYI